MAYCEDYPCCGHTPQDPCERQPYDEPGYYDTTRPGNEHALCEHEYGICDVDYYGDEECDDPEHDCQDCESNESGWECSWCGRPCPSTAHQEVTV